MIPVWKLKVHLEDISKDSQLSAELGDYAIIGRNWKKFDLTKSCLKMMQRFLIDNKTKHLLKVVDKTSKNKKWWQPNLSRFEAEKFLQSQDIGAFVVRIGNGKNFFALSLKSDEDHFDHYKIEKCDGEEEEEEHWIIVGCSKKFLSLSSLVLHFSFLKEMLPVPLSRDLVTL